MVKKDMVKTLEKCEDFRTEMTLLEKKIVERGHIMLLSPKGHPEVAGLGIEFSWGKSKYEFRRLNDCEPQHLHENIAKSLMPDVLDAMRVRRFARKTREYKRAYMVKHGLTKPRTLF